MNYIYVNGCHLHCQVNLKKLKISSILQLSEYVCPTILRIPYLYQKDFLKLNTTTAACTSVKRV